jgi:succinate dehydrogenase / fumarate reductase iron-sulfur subunit
MPDTTETHHEEQGTAGESQNGDGRPETRDYTLKIRRFDPDSGDAAYWETFEVEDMSPSNSVLDAILRARNEQDGSIAIRCSCQAAICGSCGVRVNGQSVLACNTHLDKASRSPKTDGTIVIEPMGNMPVIKDLIVDMDAVHWKKVRRVIPWLVPEGDPPEREYIVDAEAMIDVTQSMACIHCGACVSACLSMEVDPEFVGPAALAKAYRFVGDPRDSLAAERLNDLAEDPHGMYDCTHCFACIEVCPKDVAPMNQIMRLRRAATGDHGIKDSNNGYGHEKAFVDIIERWGTLHEAQLLPRSFGEGSLIKSQIHPSSLRQLIDSAPTAIRGVLSGKVSPKKVLIHPKLPDQKEIRRIYEEIESKDERLELNLYITGEGDPDTEDEVVEEGGGPDASEAEPPQDDATEVDTTAAPEDEGAGGK